MTKSILTKELGFLLSSRATISTTYIVVSSQQRYSQFFSKRSYYFASYFESLQLERTKGNIHKHTSFVAHTSANMSSDSDYAAFLEKANQDTGMGKGFGAPQFKATSGINSEVPSVLQGIQEIYISDTDEPFEPVSLKWDGSNLPSEVELARLIGYDGEISKISQDDFDPKGQYARIIKAVKEAGSSDLALFRLQHDATRAEYYVVSVNIKSSRLVGMKAVAVES